jgi:hypothetical protein
MWSVLRLCVLCLLWVFSVSKYVYSSGIRICFFSNFRLFRIMCVRYLRAIWEKGFISLWILELGICRSWRSLTIVVCIVSFIHAVFILGGSTIHPSWDRSGWRMAYLSSFHLVASTWNLLLQ